MKRGMTPLLALLLHLVVGCKSASEPAAAQGLRVVATTGIVGDVVAQVGGDLIDLSVLIPVGADPHAFEPTPQDVVTVSDAKIVFANGAGLEVFLDPLLESAGATDRVVPVSDGIIFAQTSDLDHDHGDDAYDPHTWTDPGNVVIWVGNIEDALVAEDPVHAATYKANAATYRAQLTELDGWIREEIAPIPAANRRVATDHGTLDYFADRYGIQTVAAIIPGYSSLSEPSAKELAQIEDTIRELQVKAVLVGNTVNPALGERVAQDTGARLVFIYTGSLSPPGGRADSYLAYMRYNVDAIVAALR